MVIRRLERVANHVELPEIESLMSSLAESLILALE